VILSKERDPRLITIRRGGQQLPDAIRQLVLDDQRMRNDICWSVLEV
jgi:hypothetical protein